MSYDPKAVQELVIAELEQIVEAVRRAWEPTYPETPPPRAPEQPFHITARRYWFPKFHDRAHWATIGRGIGTYWLNDRPDIQRCAEDLCEEVGWQPTGILTVIRRLRELRAHLDELRQERLRQAEAILREQAEALAELEQELALHRISQL